MIPSQSIRRHARWAIPPSALGLLALLAGCAASVHKDADLDQLSRASAPAAAAFGEGTAEEDSVEWVYRIQEGDKLEAVFFTHPEQNRFVTVRPDGRISMPYVGDLRAAGRTPQELAIDLRARYGDVLVNPRVDIIVQESNGAFYVLGEVKTPGEFRYERPLSLVQAVTRANGYEPTARLNTIVLLRKDAQERTWAGVFDFRDFMSGATKSGDVRVMPGDIVWVPRSALARWDNAARQLFNGMLLGENVLIEGWSLANFEDVFERQRF